MVTSPSTPRYARTTAASAARSSPKTSSVGDGSPRKLKRPSNLPNHARHSNFSPFPQIEPLIIKAANPRKPCHLAKLPPEIRLLIYEHILHLGPVDFTRLRRHRNLLLWPRLLRICRLVRMEVAYLFYTQTQFQCRIYNLNFDAVVVWVQRLPLAHRGYLARNKNITLQVATWKSRSTSYDWSICKRFGNIFTLSEEQHRDHFIAFCRLARWWLWCSEPVGNGIKWRYKVMTAFSSYWDVSEQAQEIRRWLHDTVFTVALPCVRECWIREKRKTEMKKEALNMVDEIGRAWTKDERPAMAAKLSSRESKEIENDWNHKIGVLRRVLAKW